MLNNKFYWGTIRKSIIAFGNMFNNIHIDRRDSSGNVVQTLKVPLAYAPRDKFIARIQAQPQSFEQSFQTFLPRMGFEMLGLEYDPARRVSMVQQNRAVSTSTRVNTQYSPSPYNININLYLYTKNQDDGLQIIEQILPYFNPDFNLTLNSVPALGLKNDLPIILNQITYDDQYEGDFTQRRAIVWTLSFTLKLNFYGPITPQGFIRTAIVNTYGDAPLKNLNARVTVTTNPGDAQQGSDFDFVETFEDF